MRKVLGILLIIGLLGSSFLGAQAQDNPTGELRGKIASYETEEPLPGANITITGTELKTITDQDGIFIFKIVPEGVYEIEVSLIGYLKTKRLNVEVKPQADNPASY